jgi:hypothetical protein
MTSPLLTVIQTNIDMLFNSTSLLSRGRRASWQCPTILSLSVAGESNFDVMCSNASRINKQAKTRLFLVSSITPGDVIGTILSINQLTAVIGFGTQLLRKDKKDRYVFASRCKTERATPGGSNSMLPVGHE